MSEEAEYYALTAKGYDRIWSWIRHQAQVHELVGCEMLTDDCEESHMVALLLPMLLPPPKVAAEMGLFSE